jgi:hypothetical protein
MYKESLRKSQSKGQGDLISKCKSEPQTGSWDRKKRTSVGKLVKPE